MNWRRQATNEQRGSALAFKSNAACCTTEYVSFSQHEIGCRSSGRCKVGLKRRYELEASSSVRQRDKKKNDVKDLTCFLCGIMRQNTANCSAPQRLILGIRQVLWYVVVCSSLLHLFGASALPALALHSPAWHLAQRKQRQRTQRALREHTSLSAVRLEFPKRLLRSHHGSKVPLLAHAAGQHNGKEKFAGTGRLMCDSVVQSVPGLNTSEKNHTCNWQWTQDPNAAGC